MIFNVNLHAGDREHNRPPDKGWCRHEGKECRPEHRGKCGKRKGDWYGARRAVRSAQEASSRIDAYFAGQNVIISNITEKPWRFEADVVNQNGEAVDRVIIDKRSGRVRSIY